MALTLKDMYSLDNNKFALTLHAGENGLRNTLTWVYLMEDIDNMDFLRGDELIITTGIQISDSGKLFSFIRTLQQSHCSGLIINVGRYLRPDNLTGDIIDYCNRKDFPLFTMPWDVHISDVMQDFCLQLSRQIQQEKILVVAFENSLNAPQYEDSYLPALIQEGYALNDTYRVVALGLSGANALSGADTLSGTNNLSGTDRSLQSVTSTFPEVYGFLYRQFYIFILRGNTAAEPDSFLDFLSENIHADDAGANLGAGGTVDSLTQLRDSFLQALFCLSVSKNTESRSVIYEQLGVYKLLYQISDTDFLKQFVVECLGVILQYDASHHADYVETLHTYLLHDCSIKETANIMITHRNTINYRIRKIRELLQMDFELQENKFRLLLAFYIREYLDYLGDMEG